MTDIYRLTVSVTVGKGQYGYDRICDHEFQIIGPLEVLRHVEFSSSVDNLFKNALDEVEQLQDE